MLEKLAKDKYYRLLWKFVNYDIYYADMGIYYPNVGLIDGIMTDFALTC
jgi:hypothetical protein